MTGHDIVVIGGSAGSLGPLRMLVAGLDPQLPACYLAVVHGSGSERPHLADAIRGKSDFPVRFAQERERFAPGVLVLAPPDRHLVVKEKEVWTTRGPRENRWRPSIDVLFRSAAIAYGTRAVGVLLSGALDDGTAGLQAIRLCGGEVLAQDPAEAEFPEMPDSALRNVEGSRCLSSTELPNAIEEVIRKPAGDPVEVPEALRIEAGYAEEAVMPIKEYEKLGEPSDATCPECGGPLRETKEGLLRYRCYTGHAFSGLVLEQQTRRDIESSLWSAVRLFQQRSNIDRALAQKESEKGRIRGADQYAQRAAEAEAHASVLHELLMGLPD
jgi:two-component system, chemotaxis family, protein-glutamate methylesterase/glutaminase